MNQATRSPQADEFIRRTNRYIAASEFLREATNWIASRAIEITSQGQSLAAVRRWFEAANVYVDEATKALFRYDHGGALQDLEELEKFVRLIKE